MIALQGGSWTDGCFYFSFAFSLDVSPLWRAWFICAVYPCAYYQSIFRTSSGPQVEVICHHRRHTQGCGAGAGTVCPEPEPLQRFAQSLSRNGNHNSFPEAKPKQKRSHIWTAPYSRSRRSRSILPGAGAVATCSIFSRSQNRPKCVRLRIPAQCTPLPYLPPQLSFALDTTLTVTKLVFALFSKQKAGNGRLEPRRRAGNNDGHWHQVAARASGQPLPSPEGGGSFCWKARSWTQLQNSGMAWAVNRHKQRSLTLMMFAVSRQTNKQNRRAVLFIFMYIRVILFIRAMGVGDWGYFHPAFYDN